MTLLVCSFGGQRGFWTPPDRSDAAAAAAAQVEAKTRLVLFDFSATLRLMERQLFPYVCPSVTPFQLHHHHTNTTALHHHHHPHQPSSEFPWRRAAPRAERSSRLTFDRGEKTRPARHGSRLESGEPRACPRTLIEQQKNVREDGGGALNRAHLSASPQLPRRRHRTASADEENKGE